MCLTKDSTVCSNQFTFRLIEGKWKQTYRRGLTINADATTFFNYPIYWNFTVNQSGDDWSTPEEYHFLDFVFSRGKSKALGKFKTEMKNIGDDYKLKIDLIDRGESMVLSGKKIY